MTPGYDPFNRVQSIVAYNGNTPLFNRRYAYRTYAEQSTTKTTNQVEYLTYRTGEGGSGTVLFGNRYLYDALGNITTVYDTSNGSTVVGQYTYDNLNQLHTEMVDGTTYTYTYDTAGNLLSVKTGDTVTASYTYGNTTWKDLLTAYNEHKIAYEGQSIAFNRVAGTLKTGNPINWWHNDTEYKNLTWENGRRLVSLKNGTSTYSYSYDMDGIRNSKTVDGVVHNYITQNGKVVQESFGTKVLQFVYDTAGAPYALRYSNDSGENFDTYYYILNLQGDVVKLVNASGSTVASYTYDAWGKEISRSGSMANINPLRYRGYYYDTETGFYYLQSRYYDPVVKRFINADSFASTGQGFLGYNMFAYCMGNSVINADSSGLYTVAIIHPDNGSEIEKDFVENYENKYDVDEFTYSSRSDFVDVWNSLENGYYNEVIIMVHGDSHSPSFMFGSQSINNINRGDAISFSELNYKSINGHVKLCTCYGALQHGDLSIAQDFSDRVSCMVVATDGIAYCSQTSIKCEYGHRWYAFYARGTVLKGRTARLVKGGRVLEEQ